MLIAIACAVPVVAGGACGGAGYEAREAWEYGYGLGAPCAPGDADCAEVETHLAAIRGEWEHWCGTVRLARMMQLEAMGERAVPTLLRELDTESNVHARVASRVLIRIGHAREVVAWCDANPDHEQHDRVCRGAPPSLR
jgi:hypothetical protein